MKRQRPPSADTEKRPNKKSTLENRDADESTRKMFEDIRKSKLFNQIQRALINHDVGRLKEQICKDDFDPEYQYKDPYGLKGNALHYFCVVTNPADCVSISPSKTSFFPAPPLYCSTEKLQEKMSLDEAKEIVALLVSRGVSLESRDPFFKQMPLSLAIAFDNTAAAITIIEMSKDKRSILNSLAENDTFSSTPLLLAIQRGNSIVFNELLQTKNVDVNLPDRFGLTPLHWAVIMGLPEMVKALVELGADVNATNTFQKKPIDYLQINKEQFELIVKEGKTSTGKTVPVTEANSTNSVEFRPIIAHFNNDSDCFLETRQRLMDNHKFEIESSLMDALSSRKKLRP